MLVDYNTRSFFSTKTIKCAFVATLFTISIRNIQARPSESEVMQQLSSIIEYRSQETLNKHAETIFKTIINILGYNANLGAGESTSHATKDNSTGDKREKLLNLLEKFLRKQKNPNIIYSDGTGMTPLHHAALLGRPKVIELLLKYDADYTIKDDAGHTALWYADPVTHAEELKNMEPKYSLLVPFIGSVFSYSAYKYWLNHQECYELLKKAQNNTWKPLASAQKIQSLKKHAQLDESALFKIH